MLGPPLGGLAIGLLGPAATMVADAASYLLSAAGLRAIGVPEPPPPPGTPGPLRAGDLLDGWRSILAHPVLRSLFINQIVVNGLIMATAPLLALLMLGRLGFAPWQYGLAFAAPCLGGLIGCRLARRLVGRSGTDSVLRIAGSLRACWSIGLAFVGRGAGGLALVMIVQFGLVTCVGIFSPVAATYRLEQVAPERLARTLAAWSVTSSATIAGLTGLWGLLAAIAGPRTAIAVAGALMLATPLLLVGPISPYLARDART
jgi:hypothetical protein